MKKQYLALLQQEFLQEIKFQIQMIEMNRLEA
jgi:hypothetical protein